MCISFDSLVFFALTVTLANAQDITRHCHHLAHNSSLGYGKDKFRYPFHLYLRWKNWILRQGTNRIRKCRPRKHKCFCTFERIAENIFILCFTSHAKQIHFKTKVCYVAKGSLLYLLHMGRYSFSKLSYAYHISNYKIHCTLILL